MERNSRGTEAVVYESKIRKTVELYSLCPLFNFCFETGGCWKIRCASQQYLQKVGINVANTDAFLL